MKPPLIILSGPTASGKTGLSVKLAEKIKGSIISADSMQVYRHMDIGTAKIKKEQMQGIPHYLIDEYEPFEEFNVAIFQARCKEYIDEIHKKGKLPILVGGTGFYIQSVLYSVNFEETEADNTYRTELTAYAKEHGAAALHEKLVLVDKESAETIHPNNVKRVIRALEYYKQTGKKISEHNKEQHSKEPAYYFRYYALTLPREVLYERINQRVDSMREEGLAEEVKKLLAMGCNREMVSMQGLGYKEILSALEGEDTIEHAFEQIKQETRHFAKRQFTWFKRERDVTWIDKGQFQNEEELLAYCIQDWQMHMQDVFGN